MGLVASPVTEASAEFVSEDGPAGEELAPAPIGLWRRFIFSTDHKVIGRQFLWLGLVFLAVAGTLAMLIRWQLCLSRQPVPVVGRLLFPATGGIVTPATYTALFTMHGTIMIFFAITPILIGGVRQLLHPAADRRARHGVPAAEHAVVLDHVRGHRGR